MTVWCERPKEEAYLLNPAFCCAVLSSATAGYASVESEGMPYPLAFMILPIILHKSTRKMLPRDTRTSLPVWIQSNFEARILFLERLLSLKSHTREAILFACSKNWVSFNPQGKLGTPKVEKDIQKYQMKLVLEAKECVRRAHFLGKWFALTGSAHTVMALWGIRP